MFKRIKEFIGGIVESVTGAYDRLRGSVRHFLNKVILSIHLAYEWLLWPRWWFVVLLAANILVAVEVMGTFICFVWPMVGLFIYLYKNDL